MTAQVAYEMAKRVRDFSWDGNFPVDPRAIAEGVAMVKKSESEEVSLPIRMEGRPLDGHSGFAEYMDGDSPYFLCVYNSKEIATRQRFTQAHELGHVLLNHVGPGKRKLRDVSFNARTADWAEIDANAFAAELIMPEKYVRHFAGKINDIKLLAQKFGTSPWAMRYRLINLGLL